jgi:predicted transcriptional regulator
MKGKKVKIGIKNMSTAMEDFVRTAEEVQRGERTKKEAGVYFTSLEAFCKVLTPRRLDFLHIIRKREPASLHELARHAERNIKNVSDDVKYLAQVGLIDLKDTENRISARVNYKTTLLEIAV